MSARNLGRRLTIAAALVVSAVAASPAQAGVLVTEAGSCEAQSYSQPFVRWLDSMTYTPVPGGAFEPGQRAWTVNGGAKVVSGNETFYVRDRSDSRSMSVPQGASVTSPVMCVGLDEPTLRFFAQRQGGLLSTVTATMAVSVQFETSLGAVVSLPVGAVDANTGWSPSLPMVVAANLLPLLPNGQTPVKFTFTAVTGSWKIDDVYVDPYRKT